MIANPRRGRDGRQGEHVSWVVCHESGALACWMRGHGPISIEAQTKKPSLITAVSNQETAFWTLFQERETGFEPATTCLEGRGSSAELLPHISPWCYLGALQSGREDLNLRPRGPKPRALAWLSYAPDGSITNSSILHLE